MFDSVLDRGQLPRGRFGAGTIVSALVHLAVVAFLFRQVTKPKDEKAGEVAVVFTPAPKPTSAPPPPPPPPPARHKHTQKKPTTTIKPKPILDLKPPTVIPEKKPDPPPPGPEEDDDDEGEDDGVEGGVVGGVKGGVLGGVVGGVVGGTGVGGPPPGPPKRLEFDDRMTKPQMLSGPPLSYTEKALEREVEGVMKVKCVITIDGKIQECQILQGLPFMNDSVVRTLQARRYAPILLMGKPVEVNFVFTIKMNLPR